MKPLDAVTVARALEAVPGWALAGLEIRRVFEFGSFREAIAFVTRVADLAEAADHHPDIQVQYRKVTLALTTHDAGGLTKRDFEMAARIDAAAAPPVAP